MATIQDYLEAAKGDIISGSCDRAIARCQHVLQYFPKHVEAHCLLAEAYREHGDGQVAEDLLLRVLSADPENLIARWALSILLDQRGERDAALGQLRVALEVRPDHAELRKEIVDLSSSRAKPTLGGLARFYMRGGLFDLSVAEFRAALVREPERLDLQIGLAEALWRAGREDEASDLCRRILDDSPDCQNALVIAGFIAAARTKQFGGAVDTPFWQAAHALDPENRVAQRLVDDMEIEVPPDWWATMHAATDLPASADKKLSPRLPAPLTREGGAGAVPEVAGSAAAPPGVQDDTALSPSPADSPLSVPEWPNLPDVGVGLWDEKTAAEEDLLRHEPAIDELTRLIEEQERASATAAADSPPSASAVPWPEATPPSAGFAPDEAVLDSAAQSDWLPTAVTEVTPDGREDAALQDGNWGEWADLLNEQITLDPAAEERLAAALVGLQGPQEAPPSGNGTGAASGQAVDATSDARGLIGDRSADGGASPASQPYPQASAADSGDHEARLAQAKAYQEAGQAEAAVTEYRTLLRVAPQLSGEVATGLRELLRAQPSHGEAHRALADAYMKIGRFQQAIDEYNQAISLEKVGT